MMNTQDPDNTVSETTDNAEIIASYRQKIKSLPRKKETLAVYDLDDTLFSRKKQLENELGLQTHRGPKGNQYMKEHIGFDVMIMRYYKGQQFPRDIIDDPQHNLQVIITAGEQAYQTKKVEAMGIDHIPMQVVVKSEDKILALITYIVFDLGHIPEKIIVYEDRPEHFKDNKQFISELLGCEVIIMRVTMNGNDGYESIQEVQ